MSWEADAACRGMGPSMFFPDPKNHYAIEKARKVCDRCPVAAECLYEHMDMPEAVVGGTSWSERRWMRRSGSGMTGLDLTDLMRASSAGSIANAALMWNTTRRTIHRWKHTGVPLRTADRICDELGMHPSFVWGAAYYLAEPRRRQPRDACQAVA